MQINFVQYSSKLLWMTEITSTFDCISNEYHLASHLCMMTVCPWPYQVCVNVLQLKNTNATYSIASQKDKEKSLEIWQSAFKMWARSALSAYIIQCGQKSIKKMLLMLNTIMTINTSMWNFWTFVGQTSKSTNTKFTNICYWYWSL